MNRHHPRAPPGTEQFGSAENVWRVTLDAFLALQLGEPDTAGELLATVPEQRAAVINPSDMVWLPW